MDEVDDPRRHDDEREESEGVEKHQHGKTDQCEPAGGGEQKAAEGGGEEGAGQCKQVDSLRRSPTEVGRYQAGIGLSVWETLRTSSRDKDLRGLHATRPRTRSRTVGLQHVGQRGWAAERDLL